MAFHFKNGFPITTSFRCCYSYLCLASILQGVVVATLARVGPMEQHRLLLVSLALLQLHPVRHKLVPDTGSHLENAFHLDIGRVLLCPLLEKVLLHFAVLLLIQLRVQLPDQRAISLVLIYEPL